MKNKKIIGLGILLIISIIYMFYPSPLLLITIAALATVLFIKSDFLAKRKNQSKSKRVGTVRHNGQKKKKRKK